jgi:Xaa-Pro aminopeptidase
MNQAAARVMAGIPATNATLYHQIRFLVGDPTAFLSVPTSGGESKTILILRDIEMDRARRRARVQEVACPADYAPEGGLSGDRETATAQATAECLRRHGADCVVADRTLPLIFADAMREIGLDVRCDREWGVSQRRHKDAQEVEFLRQAQEMTERVMRRACETVATATAGAGGVLEFDGSPLTAERLRGMVDVWLLREGYTNPSSIIACGPQGADCHELGSGPLMTGQPVIVDIFPRNRETLYNGDCTRTVVHGAISPELERMHAAVVAAKAAAAVACRAGVTGQAVHEATRQSILQTGYAMGLPPADAPDTYCAMTHGTGHGIGLDVHEPPLLDMGGPELVIGDAVTIEPGLYRRAVGGVRVEDMVIVTEDGCESLNRLPEGLDWS